MRRVVVTGMGLVTPLGGDVETTWANILAGKSGAGRITHFDSSDHFGSAGWKWILPVGAMTTPLGWNGHQRPRMIRTRA